MFDLPVAQALFQYLCGSEHTEQPQQLGVGVGTITSQQPQSPQPQRQVDVQQLAATFAAGKQQRASRVTPEQRRAMYQQLTAQIDALPAICVRSADCSSRKVLATPATKGGGNTQQDNK